MNHSMSLGVTRVWALVLMLGAGACSKTPPAAPASQPGEIPTPAREISLRPEQVRFDRSGVAREIRVERRPATRLAAHPDPATPASPAQLLVILDPATLPDPAFPETRALIVYPAGDWSKTYARLGRVSEDPLPALRGILDHQPQVIGISFPAAAGHANSRQIFRSTVRYLKFHDGRGVRFLTVYQGDPLPIADHDVVYVFHGLTDDGKYWVTLNLPLSARVLPARDTALAALTDYDKFLKEHVAYVADVGRKLESARPDDFTPRLDRIDAMLESLSIQ
jgi:hypothetical protein